MFTTQEYIVGWFMYLVGAGLVYACYWKLVGSLAVWFRTGSRVIIGTILFFPWSSGVGAEHLAPAWIAIALEFLFDGAGAMARAGLPLIIAMIMATVINGLIQVFRDSKLEKKS